MSILEYSEKQVWRFRVFGIATLVIVYLLILAGGIVRATGSGMGCPDWPKCFGTWVPPTDVSQLPPDYRERFAVAGREIAEFNAVHTWVEYVNRLLGALTGVFIFITFLLSLTYWRSDRRIVYVSLAALLGVAFVGWLGAKVVAHNLAPGMVTLHMLGALAIVGLVLYAVSWPQIERVKRPGGLSLTPLRAQAAGCLAMLIAQIVIGTQVRELVDHSAAITGEAGRASWLSSAGGLFYAHRSLSALLLLVNGWLIYRIWPLVRLNTHVRNIAWALIGVLGITIVAGMVLAYLELPAVAQPVHLLLAFLLFGVQFLLLLVLYKRKLVRPSAEEAAVLATAP